MSASPSRPNVLVGLLRVTIPSIVMIATIGVVGITAIRYFQHRSVLRGFPAQMKAEVGGAAVKAIYEYRNTHGLWPLELADIVPLQLRHLPPQDWKYAWNGYDGEVGPVLSRAGGPLDIAVQYQFPVGDEQSPSTGWTATSEGSAIWMDPSQEMPPPSDLSADELEERRREVLKSRCRSHFHDERHVTEYRRVTGEEP